MVPELISSFLYFAQVGASNLTFKNYTNSLKCELPATFQVENTREILFFFFLLIVIFKINFFYLHVLALGMKFCNAGKALSEKLMLQMITKTQLFKF